MTENAIDKMIVILVLSSNETQSSIIINNLASWLVHFTISNFNHKTKKLYKKLIKLLLNLVPF